MYMYIILEIVMGCLIWKNHDELSPLALIILINVRLYYNYRKVIFVSCMSRISSGIKNFGPMAYL